MSDTCHHENGLGSYVRGVRVDSCAACNSTAYSGKGSYATVARDSRGGKGINSNDGDKDNGTTGGLDGLLSQPNEK